MAKYERRRFLEISAAAAVAAGVTSATRPAGSSQEGARKPMRLGLIVGVGNNPERAIAKVHDLGVPTCQVGVDSFGPEMVTGLRGALDRHGIEATSLVIGGPGPEEYDFYNGPMTIGFVPREWRAKRIERAPVTLLAGPEVGLHDLLGALAVRSGTPVAISRAGGYHRLDARRLEKSLIGLDERLS